MELDARAEIRRTLDQLKPWLEAYVAHAIGVATLERLLADPRRRGRTADMQQLIRVVLEQWDRVFKPRLRPIVRTYLHEVNDFRNRWAHEESFSREDVERARSTVRLVAEALGAPPTVSIVPNGGESALGTEPHRADNGRVSKRLPTPGAKRRDGASPTDKRVGEVKARYSSTRLLFKAAIIEALEPSERFQVITPDGTFEMTKADFYRVFPNVVRSRSYRHAGVYHYPRVPSAALEFLRPTPASDVEIQPDS
jgi:hypothetical protein